MKIVIPTYRRDRQLTYSFLSKKSKKNTVFVCDERDQRRLSFMGLEDNQILVVPPEVKTIANKMAWIFRNIGEEKIMLLDDDLRFATRHSWDSTKLLPATHDEIDGVFTRVEKDLDEYPQVALGPRQGNNQQKNSEQIPGKAMYAIGYHVPTILRECVLDRIEYRADYDYTLQLLRKGLANKIIHTLVTDQSYNNPGGCREQRTVEANDRDARLLAELHPGLVKAEYREYKGSVRRVECTVFWKRALEEGLRAKSGS